MRILVCSDIHANLVALNTVIGSAGAFDRIWCLGDVVGYGPEPNACIECLRRYDLVCVAGNHDWAVVDKMDLEEFNSDARDAVLWTRNQLTVNNLDWLNSLTDKPVEMDRFTLCHGSPRHPIWEYVLSPTAARDNFDHFTTPICLLGHSHIPLVFSLDPDADTAVLQPLAEDTALPLGASRMIINPGSVGQPRDRDNRASFAMLDTEAFTLTHYRVPYDIEATQAGMEKAGLPIRLIMRLGFGM